MFSQFSGEHDVTLCTGATSEILGNKASTHKNRRRQSVVCMWPLETGMGSDGYCTNVRFSFCVNDEMMFPCFGAKRSHLSLLQGWRTAALRPLNIHQQPGHNKGWVCTAAHPLHPSAFPHADCGHRAGSPSLGNRGPHAALQASCAQRACRCTLTPASPALPQAAFRAAEGVKRRPRRRTRYAVSACAKTFCAASSSSPLPAS